MSQSNAIKTCHDLLAAAEEFNKASKALESKAALLTEAAKCIEDLHQELYAAKTSMMRKSGKKMPVTFLVDASGSMHGFPIKAVAEVASKVYESRKGTEIILMSEPNKYLPVGPDKLKEVSEDMRHLFGPPDLINAINTMSNTLPAQGKRHYIIKSDGDTFDKIESLKLAVSSFLSSHPNARIDAVILGRKNSQMEKVLAEISQSLPEHLKVNTMVAESTEQAVYMTETLMQRREIELAAQKKAKAPKAKK